MTNEAHLAKPHILVIDDDDRLRALLEQYLGENGFLISTAAHTREADALRALLTPDALVLDIMMPGETGLQYASRLRAEGSNVPILLLTARGEADDRIAGLETGADDYLVKPFAPRELLLRVEHMVRRLSPAYATGVEPANASIHFGSSVFAPALGKLTMAGEAVYLTSGEIACLRVLASHVGQPVSRETMAAMMGDVSNVRSVDVQINRLRKKIEPNPAKPVYLQTIRHAGYALYAQTEQP